jgi:tight adherence protein C
MWTSDEGALAAALRSFALLSAAIAVFAVVQQLAAVRCAAAPLYGLRGKRRKEAQKSALFRASEPLLAWLAACLSPLSLAPLRARLVVLLRNASEPAGLSPNELLASCLLSFATVGVGAAWLLRQAELSRELSAATCLLASWLPLGRVRSAAKARAKQLERSLPSAMDLCVLCMGAGADFPAALRFVVDELGAAHAVCREELAQVLDELALGRTRVEALGDLAERTGSVPVREFVGSICQSEEKGTPLIDALTIQSTTLRQRRSVRAEELAAQAGVKMMLPLMLLVSSLLLIIFGPIITTGTGL